MLDAWLVYPGMRRELSSTMTFWVTVRLLAGLPAFGGKMY